MDRVLIPFPPPWLPSWESFELSEDRSDETLRVYRTSVADFGQHLITEKGSLPTLSAVTKEDVLRYIRALDRAGKAPATQHMRFRSLRTFFGWLANEHDIEVSPVAGVKAPKLDKPKTTVLGDNDIKRLLAACGGADFGSRRDLALIRVLLEGPRRGEVTSMQAGADHLVLKRGAAWAEVVGKTGHRTLNLNDKAAFAISRYIQVRDKHPSAQLTALWLGKRGPLTPNGVYDVLERRANQPGLEDVHPHQLRHTFADAWLRAGGSEGGLMRAAGWKSRSMLDRYAASQADDRARLEHQRLGLGDRF
jgi:site-specific recombinase XerD